MTNVKGRARAAFFISLSSSCAAARRRIYSVVQTVVPYNTQVECRGRV